MSHLFLSVFCTKTRDRYLKRVSDRVIQPCKWNRFVEIRHRPATIGARVIRWPSQNVFSLHRGSSLTQRESSRSDSIFVKFIDSCSAKRLIIKIKFELKYRIYDSVFIENASHFPKYNSLASPSDLRVFAIGVTKSDVCLSLGGFYFVNRFKKLI